MRLRLLSVINKGFLTSTFTHGFKCNMNNAAVAIVRTVLLRWNTTVCNALFCKSVYFLLVFMVFECECFCKSAIKSSGDLQLVTSSSFSFQESGLSPPNPCFWAFLDQAQTENFCFSINTDMLFYVQCVPKARPFEKAISFEQVIVDRHLHLKIVQ